ncbi:hypothetical protein FGO68_gene11796 [Halteria grandinella]|uniref:Uncharacterized protein n=1 Tax=Halteria grandinella TaxID=5974 RepID=A0A8J8NCW8_HALGN|nr:hypothetical protein FGO68_gene11796 [Halteria grandinella]
MEPIIISMNGICHSSNRCLQCSCLNSGKLISLRYPISTFFEARGALSSRLLELYTFHPLDTLDTDELAFYLFMPLAAPFQVLAHLASLFRRFPLHVFVYSPVRVICGYPLKSLLFPLKQGQPCIVEHVLEVAQWQRKSVILLAHDLRVALLAQLDIVLVLLAGVFAAVVADFALSAARGIE